MRVTNSEEYMHSRTSLSSGLSTLFPNFGWTPSTKFYSHNYKQVISGKPHLTQTRCQQGKLFDAIYYLPS